MNFGAWQRSSKRPDATTSSLVIAGLCGVLGAALADDLDAHSRNPLAPNYEASEYYSGNRSGRHGIAPMRSAHAARTMKDESEIDKQRNKARDSHGKGADRPGKGDK